MKTIVEPFRIKMTEATKVIRSKERIQKLEEAHQNIFLLDAKHGTIDLLTGRNPGAMSFPTTATLAKNRKQSVRSGKTNRLTRATKSPGSPTC